MNKLFIIISLLFFFVGFSQNNSFYGAFESNGVYYSENESKDFEKKFKRQKSSVSTVRREELCPVSNAERSCFFFFLNNRCD